MNEQSTPSGAPGGPHQANRVAQPVLLVGAGGMLGRAWGRLMSGLGIDYSRTTRQELDLTSPGSIDRVIDGSWATIINCAAWTDVDGAESDPDGAHRANAESVGLLARRCAQFDATMLHHSTDYVFDGRASTPYATDHPRSPVGVYGRTKAAGEVALEESGCRFLNLRTSWLYAPWGRNFVRTMVSLLGERPELRVVNDQHGRPTSAEHLAASGLGLLADRHTGTFHVTDAGECTWFEFASEIARLIGSDCRIEACTTDEFPRPAPRPAYSVLDLDRTEQVLGPAPHWKTNLADVIGRLEGVTPIPPDPA